MGTRTGQKARVALSSFDFSAGISYPATMISSLKRPVKAVMRAGSNLKRAAREAVFRLQGRTHYQQRFYEAHLEKDIRERTNTDICDHLNTLFFMAVSARPRLLVELGTRGGEST